MERGVERIEVTCPVRDALAVVDLRQYSGGEFFVLFLELWRGRAEGEG